MKKQRKKGLSYGLFLILVGLLLIILTLYIGGEHDQLSPAHNIIIKLLEHLGVAFISIGMIGMILDLDAWREYFQERLAEIVIQKKFLEKLDQNELIDLQTNALKVFFKADNIEREESLLNFLHTKIHGFIGSPYREDVEGRISVDYSEDKNSYFIDETTTYKCRKVGDFIQDRVQWSTQKESEIDKIDEFKVMVRIPNNFFQSPEFNTSYPNISASKFIFDSKDKDGKLEPIKNAEGYSLSLVDYKGIDGLFIEISVKYHVPTDRDITWTMTHPTKGFNVTIRYPENLRMDTTVFGIDRHDYHEEHREGLYFLSYDSWMLPTTGVVFHLLESRERMPANQ